jgi:very-short-patch-repair endonuclease
MVHTSTRLRRHAKVMRRGPTRSEARVWNWFRDRRFGGYKFRRQFPVDRYVLDFYCAELKLAVEIDGRHHQSILSAYDDTRTLRLRELGIDIVRLSNELVTFDTEMAALTIQKAIDRRTASCRE